MTYDTMLVFYYRAQITNYEWRIANRERLGLPTRHQERRRRDIFRKLIALQLENISRENHS